MSKIVDDCNHIHIEMIDSLFLDDDVLYALHESGGVDVVRLQVLQKRAKNSQYLALKFTKLAETPKFSATWNLFKFFQIYICIC